MPFGKSTSGVWQRPQATDIYCGSVASACAATSTESATDAALALSGGNVGTATPLSVKSSTFRSGARPAAYAAASLESYVNESNVDCTSKFVFELTIVFDRAQRIVHLAAQSAVSPFRNKMTALWYEPMAAYGLKYKQSSKRLISHPATLNTSCPCVSWLLTKTRQ